MTSSPSLFAAALPPLQTDSPTPVGGRHLAVEGSEAWICCERGGGTRLTGRGGIRGGLQAYKGRRVPDDRRGATPPVYSQLPRHGTPETAIPPSYCVDLIETARCLE